MRKLSMVTLVVCSVFLSGTVSSWGGEFCATLGKYLTEVEGIGKKAKGDLLEHRLAVKKLKDEYVTTVAKLHPLLIQDLKQFESDAYGCGSTNPYGAFGPSQEQCCRRLKHGRANILTKCGKLSREGLQ